MSEPFFFSERRQQIIKQWRLFQRGETIDRTIVRDCIFRSWQRCRQMHVDSYAGTAKRLSSKLFQRAVAANEALLTCSHIHMEEILDMLKGSESTIVLATAEGVVIKGLPDSNRDAEGCVYQERYMGTSGVATCLVEKRPIEIFSAEHYCEKRHTLACASAPIFDVNNRIMGILSMKSTWKTYHPHTAAMVCAAARAISAQLNLRQMLNEQIALINIIDTGIILIDKDFRLRSINKKALQLLQVNQDILGMNLLSLLGCSEFILQKIKNGVSFVDEDTSLDVKITGKQLHCILSLAVTPADGRVITMQDTKRMHTYAARVMGSKATFRFEDIVGTSRELDKALHMARTAATNDTTTLIFGESGTGKELFAQAIHNASSRHNGPFVAVNCGALPKELVQSELFGYARGAFTGASGQGNPGKCELADGGTLFLDEIGEMPLEAQTSLLRLLQNREVTRVGGKMPRRVNIRFIAATNKDLVAAVAEKTFREDLYYRLNVFSITVPPLRVRGADVAELALFFLKKYTKGSERPKTLAPEVLHCLGEYPWPGNVRELENAIARAVSLAAGAVITVADLPENVRQHKDKGTIPPQMPAAASDYDMLCASLQQYQGHVSRTARALGMARSTLYYKMRSYGIDPRNFRQASPAPVASPFSTAQLAYLHALLKLPQSDQA